MSTSLTTKRSIFLISSSLLAFVVTLPAQRAHAQEDSKSAALGKPILPSAQTTWAKAVTRTPHDMQASESYYAKTPVVQNARPAPRPTMGEEAYRAAKAAADAAYRAGGTKAAPVRNVSPLLAPTTIIQNKAGPTEAGVGNGFYPPDSNGAIGPYQVVMPVNLSLNVYNRVGALKKSTTFNAFFNTTESLSDPRVVYDPIWNRWVVTLTTVPTSTSPPACFWIAASTSSDATSSWHVYHPCIGGGPFANGDLWDYDMLGISQDAIFVTGNIFGQTSFKGPAVLAAPKASIYNGLGWSSPVFTPGTQYGTISPPRVLDSNADAYFLAASGNALDVFRGTNLSNQSQFSFVLQAAISYSYNIPPSAAQPGTTAVLDTLDGRFQQAGTQYSNFLWNTHTEALGTFPAPKFFQIDTNANSVVQSGYFFASSTSDDFNPSIQATSAGNVFVTWSETDPPNGVNATVRFSGRQSGDAAGVIGAGTALYTSPVALTGNTQNGVQRWGDYSAVTLDPVNSSCGAGGRAAIFNEDIINANTWGIRYGLIGFCP